MLNILFHIAICVEYINTSFQKMSEIEQNMWNLIITVFLLPFLYLTEKLYKEERKLITQKHEMIKRIIKMSGNS